MFRFYAKMYWALLPIYKDATKIPAKSKIEKRFHSELYKSLKWLLKHCGTLVPPKASKEALKMAEGKIDLFALQWKDQPAAEEYAFGLRGRYKFIHEHQFPVSELYDDILKSESEDEIFNILKRQSIVWIIRDENKKLPRNIRNKDEYNNCGIIVVPNKYSDCWMEHNWKI